MWPCPAGQLAVRNGCEHERASLDRVKVRRGAKNGRYDQVRAPNRQALKGAAILAMPLTEASAKCRSGPPDDDDDDSPDAAINIWGGVIAVTSFGSAIASPETTTA